MTTMSIEVNDESGETVDGERIASLARFVLDRLKVHPQAELSVLAVDVETMSSLHLQWMDEEGPTDVLSFPMDELRPGSEVAFELIDASMARRAIEDRRHLLVSAAELLAARIS